MSEGSVAYEHDNSAYLHFQIMSPDPYFYIIFGAQLYNSLKYFNDTWQNYITGQRGVSHIRMTTPLIFVFQLCPLIHICTSFLEHNFATV